MNWLVFFNALFIPITLLFWAVTFVALTSNESNDRRAPVFLCWMFMSLVLTAAVLGMNWPSVSEVYK